MHPAAWPEKERKKGKKRERGEGRKEVAGREWAKGRGKSATRRRLSYGFFMPAAQVTGMVAGVGGAEGDAALASPRSNNYTLRVSAA